MIDPPEEAVEAAARALYESSRQPEYLDDLDYDWENIDRAYDWDGDDDEPHGPEWCRDRYRADARTVWPIIEAAVRRRTLVGVADEIELHAAESSSGEARAQLQALTQLFRTRARP